MRTTILACSILAASVAACGSGGDDGAAVDAPGAADAVVQRVHTVACTGTPAGPITTPTLSAYAPSMVTIAPGGLVRFMLGATHNVTSTTPGQMFSVPFGGTACLQFDTAGTYTFRCSTHLFTGTVVVQ